MKKLSSLAGRAIPVNKHDVPAIVALFTQDAIQVSDGAGGVNSVSGNFGTQAREPM